METAIKPHTFQGKEWDPKKHVHEMPTDAFGDIVFTGLSQKAGKVGSVTVILHRVGPCDPVADFLEGGGRMRVVISVRVTHYPPRNRMGWCALFRQTSRRRSTGHPKGGMGSF